MKKIYLFLIVLSVFVYSNQEQITFNNGAIKVNFTNCGSRTHFILVSRIQNGVNIDASWLGITLDTDFSSYAGANVIVCKKNGPTVSVEQYVYSQSKLVHMNETNKFIGLNSISVDVTNDEMTCKFTRENKDSDPLYLNMNTEKLFMKVSYGSLVQDVPQMAVSEYPSPAVVNFPVNFNCEQWTSLENDKIMVKFRNYGSKTFYEATVPIENDVSIDNVWLGIGINTNREMSKADVVICKRNSTFNSVEHYYNDGLVPKYIDETNIYLGLSSMYVGVSGNLLICRFTRENYVDNKNYRYQNGENLFVIVAYGSFMLEKMEQHSFVKASNNIVSFPIQPSFNDYTTLKNEKLKVEFKNCGTITHFTVTAVIEDGVDINNVWVGMGLNEKRRMSGADVIVCKKSSTLSSVEHYYNDGIVPKYINPSNRFEGLSSMSISTNGNVLTCKFSRDNSNPNPSYRNLNTENLFIISGYGSLNGEELIKHNSIKVTENIALFPATSNCQDYATLNNDEMIIKYRNYGSQTEFIATALIEKGFDMNSVYLAVGLNLNQNMPDANGVICKKSASQTFVEHYWNNILKPVYFDNSNKAIGLSNTSLTVSGNKMTCRFYRDNSNENSKYLDINKDSLFLIMAYGSLSGQNLIKHKVVQQSKNPLSFPIVSNDVKSYTLKDFKIEWIEKADEIDFVFQAKVKNSNNLWAGFGLSNDDKMGDDNVIVCKLSGSSKSIEHYYDSGKFRPNLLSELEPSVGLSNLKIELNNGVLTCSFSRQKSRSDIQNYFDSNKNYFILFGVGPANDKGIIFYHSDFVSSKTLLDFQSGKVIQPPSPIGLISTTTTAPELGGYSRGDFSLNWNDYGNKTNFTFVYKMSEPPMNFYIAFAFSKDYDMGDDDVIACKITGTGESVERYYNKDKSEVSQDENNPKIGLSSSVITYDDGKLTCSFSREKSNPSIENYFDLNKKYYILFARGPTGANGKIGKHNIKEQGTLLIDFNLNYVPSTTKSNRVSKPVTEVTASGNFSYKDYRVAWNNTMYFTFFNANEGESNIKNRKSKRQSSGPDKYLAFGLSKDKIMGDDCIIVCKMSNNIGSVEHYLSKGQFEPGLLEPTEPTIGIADASVYYVNGNLYCKFRREKYIEGNSRYCDGRNKYFLQIAEGDVSENKIKYHKSLAFVSDTEIDFSINSSFSGSARDSAKVKAHASLMIFAWLFCVSTGIILARYYKFILPSIKIQKMMFWFQAHRTLMIFTPICSIAGFLVILADLNWKWVSITNKVSFAHSIIGMIVIGFSLIQILMGLLRPDKDAPRRPIFNVLHRFLGISCLTLSVVVCFLGVFIERVNLGRIGWGIMIGWTMWVIILPLLIELVQVICVKKKSDLYQVATDKLEPDTSNINNKIVEAIKTFLLILHLIIALGHVIALIVIIAIAEPDKFESS